MWLTLISHDNPRPDHTGLRHYRVLDTAHGGATIRASPHSRGLIIGRLPPGAAWHGEPVIGQRHAVDGLGSSDVWIQSDDGRLVWSGMLEEEVTE